MTKKRGFQPGVSGNPEGRPQGVPDRRRILRDTLSGELPAIVAKLVDAAKAGDVQAASLIMSRCLPPLRPQREPTAVPGIPGDASATEVAQALVAAATRGELASDAAAELIAALAAVARIREVDELTQRIATLESRHE